MPAARDPVRQLCGLIRYAADTVPFFKLHDLWKLNRYLLDAFLDQARLKDLQELIEFMEEEIGLEVMPRSEGE